jgi:heme a synthase
LLLFYTINMEIDSQQLNRSFIKYTWFTAIFVLIVIAAGGIVRTTQSGMGCPDWPTCFGMWIPPTSAADLPPDFEKYLRQQDIDHTFNAYHTWIEYLNRDVAALLGVFLLILTVWAYFKFYKNNRRIFWWSVALLILTGFQAWLGKKVVDANLAAVKVTAHMLIALAIAAIPLYIIYLLRQKPLLKNTNLKWLVTSTLVIVLIQIVLGTQVRERVDEVSQSLGYQQRNLWIERLGTIFIIHRSFSWVVALLSILVFVKSYKLPSLQKGSWLVAILAASSIALGIIMAYLNIPAFAQPLHLLTGTLLVLTLFHLRLGVK